MELWFAPLEGLTGHIYRTAHAAHFAPADGYMTPFLSPGSNRHWTSRQASDVLPAHNQGLHVVPQLLTHQAEPFLWAAENLAQMGYREVNLNLGCPSGTVTAKKKGAGFLGEPAALDAFLDTVCARSPLPVSVKTRLGMHSEEEFAGLLEIYNRYPLARLIVHPRVRDDYYKNTPHMEAFRYAVQHSRAPVCYNGDLFTPEDVHAFCTQFPQVEQLMLGRGLLANPALIERLRGGQGLTTPRLRAFHDELLARYRQELSGDVPVTHKMKELWHYMGCMFPDFARLGKALFKARRLDAYQAAAARVFDELELAPDAGFRPQKA